MSLSQLMFSSKLFPVSFTAPTNEILIKKLSKNTLKLGLLILLSVLRVFFIIHEQEQMSGEKCL